MDLSNESMDISIKGTCPMNSDYIAGLPDNIWKYICEYCDDADDLFDLMSTCSGLWKLKTEPGIWETFYEPHELEVLVNLGLPLYTPNRYHHREDNYDLIVDMKTGKFLWINFYYKCKSVCNYIHCGCIPRGESRIPIEQITFNTNGVHATHAYGQNHRLVKMDGSNFTTIAGIRHGSLSIFKIDVKEKYEPPKEDDKYSYSMENIMDSLNNHWRCIVPGVVKAYTENFSCKYGDSTCIMEWESLNI